MEFDLKRTIQALLLSSSDPLDVKSVLKVVGRYHQLQAAAADSADDAEPAGPAEAEGQGDAHAEAGQEAAVPSLVTRAQVREAFEQLQREAEADGAVHRIVETPDGFRIATAPEFAEWVRLLRGDPRPLKLSPAALETLAIVAYRQPVTRAEIERVRGVSSDSALGRLIELELVQVTGRADLPGRPIQYGTDSRFLELVGVATIDELPASDVLTPGQLDALLRDDDGVAEELSDSDVGLSPERAPDELPLDEPFAAIRVDGGREAG